MTKEPVYKDIDFSFIAHPLTGDLTTITDERSIKQSLRNLLSTHYYERGFNVLIGSNIKRLLFDPVTDITVHRLREEIENLINNFEPRISLSQENIEVGYTDQHTLTITLVYEIIVKQTTEKFSFILERVR